MIHSRTPLANFRRGRSSLNGEGSVSLVVLLLLVGVLDVASLETEVASMTLGLGVGVNLAGGARLARGEDVDDSLDEAGGSGLGRRSGRAGGEKRESVNRPEKSGRAYPTHAAGAWP